MIGADKSRWKFYSRRTVKLYIRHTVNPRFTANTLEEITSLLFYFTILKYSLYIRLCSFASVCFETIYVSCIGQRTLVKLCWHWTDPNFSVIAFNAPFSVSSSGTSISCVFPTRAPKWIKGTIVWQKEQKIVSRKSAGETWTLISLMNSVYPREMALPHQGHGLCPRHSQPWQAKNPSLSSCLEDQKKLEAFEQPFALPWHRIFCPLHHQWWLGSFSQGSTVCFNLRSFFAILTISNRLSELSELEGLWTRENRTKWKYLCSSSVTKSSLQSVRPRISPQK